MKKTNRLSRLLAMLLALAMLVNSQGMTSMAAVIGGVTGGKKQTEAPQTETEPATEAVAQTEAQEPESAAETELTSEAQSETELESELETEIESESESEGLTAAELFEEETESESESESELPTVAEPQTYTYRDEINKVTIEVTVPEGVELPYGAVLNADPVSEDSEEYKNAIASILEANPDYTINGATFYDVYFTTADGTEVEPVGGDVSVSMRFDNALKTEVESASEQPEVMVAHVKDDGEVEDVTDEVNLNKNDAVKSVEFTVDSFSFVGPIFLTLNDYTTTDTIPSYSLKYLLQGYNAVALGDVTMNQHTMGGILTKGDLKGSSTAGYADSPLVNPSYIKGKVHRITQNGQEQSSASLVGGTLNGRTTYYWKPLYVGSNNTVKEPCDIKSPEEGCDGGKKLNDYEGVYNKIGKKAEGENNGSTYAPIYITDDYVDWKRLESAIRSGVDYLKKDSVETPTSNHVDDERFEYYDTTGQNSDPLEVKLGSNVSFTLGDKKDTQYYLKLTGDSDYSTKTVITILDSGEVQLPIIKAVNDKDLVTTEDNAHGMSVVFLYPNATKVKLPSDSTFGHVIAPNADIVSQGGNYSGCLIGQNIELNGEGHMWPFSDDTLIPDQEGFHARKTVNGNEPSEDEVFTFYLDELKDSKWENIETKSNDGSKITFSEQEYGEDSEGDHWYLIHESQETKDGYTTSRVLYVVKVTVEKKVLTEEDGDTVTTYTVAGTTYYKAKTENADDLIKDGTIDVGLLESVSESEDVVFNNTTDKEMGDITITKTLKYNGEVDLETEASFDVALFSDAAGTMQVSEKKTVTVEKGKGVGSVKFDGLTVGETYYVFELDADGKPVGEGYGYKVTGSGTGVEITREDLHKTVSITNDKEETGDLTVTKTLQYNGKVDTDTDATFYVALFDNAASDTPVSEVKAVEIKKGGTGSSSVMFDGLTVGKTYYVFETDETGKKVAGSEGFGYSVDGEGAVMIERNDLHKTASITNNKSEKGSIKVTKTVTYNGEVDEEANTSFNVALFSDADGTEMVGEMQTVDVKAGKGEVTFDELTVGDTYYVFEVDAAGQPVGETYGVYKVTGSGAGITIERGVLNYTADLTNAQEEKGEIKVTKKLQYNGREDVAEDAVFYVALFDAEGKKLYGPEEIKLENASENFAEFKELPFGTYYVKETTEDGTPVGTGSEYVVTGEESVTLGRHDLNKEATITNNKVEAKIGLEVNKELTGRELKADEFRFTLEANDKAYAHTVKDGILTVKNDADGKIDFGTDAVTIKLDDMADVIDGMSETGVYTKEFGYTLMEQPTTQPAGDSSIKNDPEWLRRLTLEATYNEKTGTLSLEWLDGADGQTFTNEYDTKAKTGVEVTKKLVGLDMTGSNLFTFELTGEGDAASTVVTGTAYNDPATGKVSFADAIEITLDDLKINDNNNAASYPDKTFTYHVREVVPEGADEAMKYDTHTYTFTVNAHYDFETGELTLETTEVEGDTTFTNEWTAKAEVPLNGFKTLKDLNLEAGKYSFAVYNAGDVTVAEDGTVTTTGDPVLGPVTNAADGSITFGSLSYDLDDIVNEDGSYPSEKTFTYKVVETQGNDEGITYDTSVKTVRVRVTYSTASGELKAELADGSEELSFVNEYDTEKEIGFEAAKEMHGRDLTEEDIAAYKFTLTADEGTDPKTVQKAEATIDDVSGAITGFEENAIKITLDDMADVLAGTGKDGIYTKEFKYTLTESGERPSVDNAAPKHLTVTATYNKNTGVLELALTKLDNLTFVNTYHAEGMGKVEGTKELTGRELKNKEFTFVVKDKDGNAIGSEQNREDGGFQIDGIGKYVNGAVVPFTEKDVENAADGKVVFHYTLSEVKGTLSGVNYSDKVYDLTVTVTDNGDGTLKVDVQPDGGDIEFVNTYTTRNWIGLDETKVLHGRELKAGEFRFTLEANDPENAHTVKGGILTVKNDADGKIDFGTDAVTITLADMADVIEKGSEDGVYTKQFGYTLMEQPTTQPAGDSSIKNDPEWLRRLTLEATYNEKTGTLSLKWLDGADEQTFTNEYDTKAKTGVEVTKKLVGLDIALYPFTFQLEKQNADGTWAPVGDTVTSDAEGKVSFADAIVVTLDDLKVTAEDGTVSYPNATFTYRVSEVKPEDAKDAMIYDTHPYTFTVTASYNFETGVLTLTKDEPAEGKEFTNTWTAKAEVPLIGFKTQKDLNLTEGKYTFNVYKAEDVNADGTVKAEAEPVLTATNAANGGINFGSLSYDLDDMKKDDGTYEASKKFEYKVLEEQKDEKGITYDTSVKTVVVQVTYSTATGEMHAALIDGTELLAFVNEYDTEATIGFEAAKEMHGRTLTEDDVKGYRFTLTADDEAYAETVQTKEAAIDDVSGAITDFKDNAIKITLDDMADVLADSSADGIYTKEFSYTLTESGDRPSVTNAAPKHLTVTATYNKNSGVLKLALTKWDNLTFVNTYHAEGVGKVEGTKTLHGRDLKDNEFTFAVEDEDGHVLGLNKNRADGGFQIGGIGKWEDGKVVPFTEEDVDKTYHYTLYEVKGSLAGIEYATNTYALTVKVTDNGDGTLTVEVTPDAEKVEFVNTYTTRNWIGLDETKVLTGRELKAGEFRFTLEADDPENAHTVKGGILTVKNDANGKIDFGTDAVTITLADMADVMEKGSEDGVYTKKFGYTLMEQPTTQPAGDSSIKNDENWLRRLTLKATYDEKTGTLSLEWLDGADEQTFTNEYDTQAKTGVEVTKKLVGLDMTESNLFTFTLTGDGDAASTVATGTAYNDPATGKVSFADAIEITLDDLKINDNNNAASYPDKTFTYHVTEVVPEGADEAMKYDTHTYTFTVDAHYDFETGVLTLTNHEPDAGKEFTNTWTADTSIPFYGFKTQKDLKLEEGKYSFAVYNADDVTVAEDGTVTTTGDPVLGPVTNAANGSITFGSLSYDLDDIVEEDGSYPAEKTFEYKVLEIQGDDESITYDPSVKTVVVKLTYSTATGELKATTTDGTELLAFVNEYDTDAEIGFEAAKEMHGRELTEEDVFTFTLTADDEAYAGTVQTATATNDASGAITGFKDNAIKVTLDDMADVLATPRADGIYTKQFSYTLTESGSRPSVTNDPNAKHLTVTATYDKNSGELRLMLTKWDNLTFVNTYHAEGVGKVEGTKTLHGRELKDNEFTFAVEDEAHHVLGLNKNRADGGFQIGGIGKWEDGKVVPFTEKDAGETYHYKLYEVKGSLAGIEYATNTYDLTVTVTDNGDGTLTVEVTPDGEDVEFVNTYTTRNWIGLNETKVLHGRELKDGEFRFTLEAKDEAYAHTVRENGLTVANDADGKIDFGTDAVTITLADMADVVDEESESDIYTKEFKYMLSEQPTTQPEGDSTIKNDPVASRELTLKATYNEKTGILTLEWLDDADEQTFTNEYDTQAKIGLEVEKKLIGKQLNAGDFTFVLFGQGTNGALTKTNDENGKVDFTDAITIKLADMADAEKDAENSKIRRKTFTYVLSETPTSEEGVTNDPVSYRELTLEATYDESTGELTLEWLNGMGSQTFVNTYDTQASTGVELTKELTGLDLKASAFTFKLENLIAGNVEDRFTSWQTIATTSNDADGKASFADAIVVTLDDLKVNDENTAASYPDKTFTYRVSEVKPDGADEAMIYDENAYTFTVVAHYDFENGVLTLTNDAPTDGYTFKNEWTAETNIPLTGFKTQKDLKLEEGKYSFAVYKADDVTVAEDGTVTTTGEPVLGPVKNAAEGGINFGTLEYDLDDIKAADGSYPGETTFSYKVLEIKGDDESITYDPSVKTVNVKVTYDSATGELKAALIDGTELLAFVNEYDTEDTIGFEAAKEMHGRELTEEDVFTFTLTADDEAYAGTVQTATATNDASGAITGFKDNAIKVTLDDMADVLATPRADGIYTKQFSYTLTESGSRPSVTNDPNAKHLTVTATYDKNSGELTLALTKWDNLTFINTYEATGSVPAGGLKKVNGKPVTPEQIERLNKLVEFQLEQVDGTTVTTLESKSLETDGTFEFTDLAYTQADIGKTYTYQIKESQIADDEEMGGYTIDGTVYTFTVKVEDSDEHDGTLKLTVADADGNVVEGEPKLEAEFDNKLTVEFHVNKTEVGDNSKEVAGAEITVYEVTTDEEGNPVETEVDSWTSTGEGSHDFGDKLEEGKNYVLRETVAPDGYAYTTDIEFSVTDNGEIETNMPKTTGENGETVYLVEDAPLKFNVNKTEVGDNSKEVAGAEITVYELTTDEDGNTVETKVDSWTSKEGETHDFGGNLKAGGKYVMRETVAPDGYAYTNDIEFTIDKDGKVTTDAQTVTDEEGNVTYLVEDAPLKFNVNKTEVGDNSKEVAGAEITVYELTTDEDGNTVETKVDSWTSKEGETHDFGGKLKAGGKYVMRETVAPDGYAYTNDIEFTIDKDGKVTTDAQTVTDEEGNVTYLVEDAPIVGKVTLTKLSEADRELLAGAAFQLYYKTDETESGWALYNNASYVTGIDGTLTVSGLTANDYYFVETEAPAGFVIATDENGEPMKYPFTIALDEADKTNAEVSVELDVTNAPDAKDTTLVVTKQLVFNDELWNAVDATFYVALFEDKELTKQVSEIQPIVFENSNTSSTTFENLEIGKTYYVAETDAEGKVLNGLGGRLATGEMFRVDFYDDNVVTVNRGDGTKVIYFRNVFRDIPEEFYREGELTVTKQLLKADGTAKKSNKTFYAGIFDDAAFTQLSGKTTRNVLTLAMNGTSSVSDTVKVTVPEDGQTTVYVTEVDKNGNPVAGAASFKYDVTVDGSTVTMDLDHLSASVVITNQEREKESEEESEVFEEAESEGTVPASTKAVKTGDDTPIALYVGLLAAAALLLILAFVLKRRKKS